MAPSPGVDAAGDATSSPERCSHLVPFHTISPHRCFPLPQCEQFDTLLPVLTVEEMLLYTSQVGAAAGGARPRLPRAVRLLAASGRRGGLLWALPGRRGLTRAAAPPPPRPHLRRS
jgi:hypothetical protein